MKEHPKVKVRSAPSGSFHLFLWHGTHFVMLVLLHANLENVLKEHFKSLSDETAKRFCQSPSALISGKANWEKNSVQMEFH